jgi:uncharacterized protein YecT (DUF1311 family)
MTALVVCSFCQGADLKDDLSKQSAAVEAELQLACLNLVSVLGPRENEHFKEAQQKWQSFRDAEASFHAGLTSGGGSAYSVDYQIERLELTRERIKVLKKIYEASN